MQAFILGLSTGAICISYCAPALLPFLFIEGDKARKNFVYLGIFMAGRLCGYVLFAVIAWVLSKTLLSNIMHRELIYGSAFLILSVLLIFYCFKKTRKTCGCHTEKYPLFPLVKSKYLLPLIFGFLTGVNICPPFLLAFTGASTTGGLFSSIIYFLTFFMGTAVFFLPIPLIGILNIHKPLKTIGKMSAAVASAYYFYLGLINIVGSIGMKSL